MSGDTLQTLWGVLQSPPSLSLPQIYLSSQLFFVKQNDLRVQFISKQGLFTRANFPEKLDPFFFLIVFTLEYIQSVLLLHKIL